MGQVQRYAAYDIGGSGAKMFAAIFDGMRLSVREVHRISYTPIAARTGLYWDFFRIFETMAHGLRQLQVEGDICSLGIDSFSNDFGFINSQGELLTTEIAGHRNMKRRCTRFCRNGNCTLVLEINWRRSIH